MSRRANYPARPRNAIAATNPVPGAFGDSRAKTRPFSPHVANPAGAKILRRMAKRATKSRSEHMPLQKALDFHAATAARRGKEPKFPLGDRRNRPSTGGQQ